MIYGDVDIKVKFDSLSFVFGKSQRITHIPYTNQSFKAEKGKEATRINCTLKATSLLELATMLTILNSAGEKELHFKHFYFKQVTAGQRGLPRPVTTDEKIWLVDAEFIAL